MTNLFKAMFLAALSIPVAAQAADITINLSGNAVPSSVSTSGNRFYQTYSLTDVDTGGDVPSFTFSVGDVISGTIDFSSPLTIPAGFSSPSNVGFYGFNLGYLDGETNVNAQESFSYSLLGAPATPPPQYMNFGGSDGFVFPGQYTEAPAGLFTFDKISYSFNVTGISDINHNELDTATTDTTAPDFEVQTAAAVPEPASWAMMILGIGGVGAVLRRQGSARNFPTRMHRVSAS